ncbi:MAG: hypothetical protein WCX90_00245 [Thiohalomonadaceae bacterium]
MIITQSNLQMQSGRSYLQYQRQHESLTTWKNGENGQREQITQTSSREQLKLETSSSHLQMNHRAMQARLPAQNPNQSPAQTPVQLMQPAASNITASAPADKTREADATVGGFNELQLTAIMLLIERLTGRKLEIFIPNKSNDGGPPAVEAQSGSTNQGRGSVYTASQIHYEWESTTFSAQGIVHTADGQEIQLSLQLNMSREFLSQTNVSVRSGDALKDPLVINFDGNAAELTHTKFAFDIDANGKLDEISFVKPGSGFLALDRNDDGVINDGAELFGALTGNGFAELARYDEDGNGWIDENDTIFASLLIWSRDANGKDQFSSLKEHDIGAIYLDHIETQFALKDSNNDMHGQVRSSGIFLNESGKVGTVQQLDLVV